MLSNGLWLHTAVQYVLLFLVVAVNSVQFQILRTYTLLLKLPVLMHTYNIAFQTFLAVWRCIKDFSFGSPYKFETGWQRHKMFSCSVTGRVLSNPETLLADSPTALCDLDLGFHNTRNLVHTGTNFTFLWTTNLETSVYIRNNTLLFCTLSSECSWRNDNLCMCICTCVYMASALRVKLHSQTSTGMLPSRFHSQRRDCETVEVQKHTTVLILSLITHYRRKKKRKKKRWVVMTRRWEEGLNHHEIMLPPGCFKHFSIPF